MAMNPGSQWRRLRRRSELVEHIWFVRRVTRGSPAALPKMPRCRPKLVLVLGSARLARTCVRPLPARPAERPDWPDYAPIVAYGQSNSTSENARTMSPEKWYDMYIKPTHPELAEVAMRVLSQVLSASSCERNWSSHGHIHSKVRNRLASSSLEKLVYSFIATLEQITHEPALPRWCLAAL